MWELSKDDLRKLEYATEWEDKWGWWSYSKGEHRGTAYDFITINGVGVIDSDYFNNPDNEGEIGFAFYNITDKPVTIKAGEKLGQGVFTTYLTADNEVCPTNERTGGFGSTGK